MNFFISFKFTIEEVSAQTPIVSKKDAMKSVIFFIFLFFSGELFGQAPQPYKLSGVILKTIETDTVDTTDYKNQKGAWEFSFIGDHKNSLLYMDKGDREPSEISKEDSLYFLNLNPINAKKYILRKASDEQIIIMNEAHHVPLHRIFASAFLQGLYDLGYRYFGAEAIFHEDSSLSERKYPILETGYYTKEPQFGNLIRSAFSIGYEVFPYEADFSKPIDGKEREIQQAKNIQNILKKDPGAKIFIYAGYDHIREDSLNNPWGKAMAGRLKEYTGIDPFTVDQVSMMKKSKTAYENPFSRLNKSKTPVVYVDSVGNPLAESVSSKKFDVSVFHPETKYVNGRPDWVFSLGRTPEFVNRKVNISCPCLILAYKAGEDLSQAVPVDVMELENKSEKKALALKKGIYNIIIKNIGGKQQTLSIKR